MTRLEIIQLIVQQYLGIKYKWGGFNPDGIDCSGLCQEILWSVGMLPDKVDRTAQSLYNLYKSEGLITLKPPESHDMGCLVFFHPLSRPGKITHTEMLLSRLPELISLGARGGRFTRGRVMIRPVHKYRRNMTLAGYADTWNWPKG